MRARSIRGGTATLLSHWAKFLLQAVSTVALARLLTPADFGLIAMVTAVTGFIGLFKDLGLSAATIQQAEITHDQISTLFWVNAGLGMLVAAIVVAVAPAIAWFYGDPRLTPITMVLGASFVLSGLAIQHSALLSRNMRFITIGVIEIISMAVSVAAGIVAGLLGAGYWALVIMTVAGAAANVVGKWVAYPWLPGWPKRGAGVRVMIGFGGYVAGFNIFNYFTRNLDNVLIGKFVGSAPLGFYSKAYSLLMLPIREIRTPIARVAMPALSLLQAQPERYRNYYMKMVQLVALLSMPTATVMGAFSRQIIVIVLGPQWEESAPIFAILALSALIQPAMGTVGSVLLSLGQGRRYFRLGLWASGLFVGAYLVGLPWGVEGVAWGHTVATYLNLLPAVVYSLHNTPIRPRDFFKAISIPFYASLVMLLGSRLVFHLGKDYAETPAFIVASLVGAVIYLGAFFVLPGGIALLKDLRLNLQLLYKSRR